MNHIEALQMINEMIRFQMKIKNSCRNFNQTKADANIQKFEELKEFMQDLLMDVKTWPEPENCENEIKALYANAWPYDEFVYVIAFCPICGSGKVLKNVNPYRSELNIKLCNKCKSSWF